MKDIKDCVENANSKILQILQDLHESAKSHRILDNIDINCIDNADICDIEEFYSCLIAEAVQEIRIELAREMGYIDGKLSREAKNGNS